METLKHIKGKAMGEKSRLENEIEKLRQRMLELIDKEGSFLNAEVIKASQELDQLLNEYNRILGY